MAAPLPELVPGAEDIESLTRKVNAWGDQLGVVFNQLATGSLSQLNGGVFSGATDASGFVRFPYGLPYPPSAIIIQPVSPTYFFNASASWPVQPVDVDGYAQVGCRGWVGGTYGVLASINVKFSWLAFRSN